MTPPRVFISYSHDSDAHRAAVLDLANRLRADGVDAVLDRYVNGSPTQGWPRWMLDELDRATHVLCVCTSTYYGRFRGHKQPGKGKGVAWEGAVISQELYDAGCQNRRFIPVLVGNVDISSIPEPLRGATRYQAETDFRGLYDAILGRAGVEVPPLGQLKSNDQSGANVSEGGPPAVPSAVSTISSPAEPTPEELASVHSQTVSAIESELDTAAIVAQFLGPDAPADARLVQREDSSWKVLPPYARGDADTTPVLRGIAGRLARFRGPKQEWDALEKVVGGVLVMGMNPRWVWHRRRMSKDGAVPFPKLADDVQIGPSEHAHFLSAIASALVGGCAKLEQVFGPLDALRIPDLSKDDPNLTLADRQKEMKRHLVHSVFRSDEWDVDALDGEHLNVQFQRVVGKLRVAFEIDCSPYFSSGPRMAQRAAEIKKHMDKERMDFSDLLLLFTPVEPGSELNIMPDSAVRLILLKRIHTHIQKHRPSI